MGYYEEYFDIVDECNKLTGKKCLRSDAHKQGLWHRTVHIYLFRERNKDIEFLVHLRSKTKDLSPDRWDTRFGGHLKSGENVEDAIKDELKDEIGLKLEIQNLIEGEVYKCDKYQNKEFTYTYYYRFDKDITALNFNDGEVQEIKWMESKEILKEINKEPDRWSAGAKGFIEILDVLGTKLK